MLGKSDITPEKFVKVFGPALQEFLEQSYGKDGANVLDLLAQSGTFFDAAYHASSSLDYAGYLDVTTTVEK